MLQRTEVTSVLYIPHLFTNEWPEPPEKKKEEEQEQQQQSKNQTHWTRPVVHDPRLKNKQTNKQTNKQLKLFISDQITAIKFLKVLKRTKF